MLAKPKETKESKETKETKEVKNVLEETAWVPPKVAISVWSETVKKAMEEATQEVRVSEFHRNCFEMSSIGISIGSVTNA